MNHSKKTLKGFSKVSKVKQLDKVVTAKIKGGITGDDFDII